MTDTTTLKQSIDCQQLIARDLGEGKRSGQWMMYRCPFHADDKPSMGATSTSWYCFGCNAGGDAIAWMQQYHKMSFAEALKALGGEPDKRPVRALPRYISAPAAPPPLNWQADAWHIIERAQDELWSESGAQAREYLERRGFAPKTLDLWQIGYVPGAFDEWVRWHNLSVPCGILIPWVTGGQVWALKVRRSHGDPKYLMVKGSNTSGVYLGATILSASRKPLVLIEGEFNALSVWQAANKWVSVISPGSASGIIDYRWWGHLATLPEILLVADKDQAGDKMREKYGLFAHRMRAVTIPEPHKDANDLLIADGNEGIVKWLKSQYQ